jgi:hypothetical protein
MTQDLEFKNKGTAPPDLQPGTIELRIFNPSFASAKPMPPAKVDHRSTAHKFGIANPEQLNI